MTEGRVETTGSGIEDLARAMASGRAVLIIGQRHSRGLLDDLRRDVAAMTGQSENEDLISLLSAVRNDAELDGLRRAFTSRSVTPELLALAENPWAFVLTSAIDSYVSEAFQQLASSGRQLRVLFAGQTGTLARSASATLTLLRLFGALEERDKSYRPPSSEHELLRRRRLEVPVVLNELPVLVGPGGHLVCVGLGADDWLDVETLALSCSDFPPDSIHWFGVDENPIDPEELERLFEGRIRLYARSLPEELELSSSTEAIEALDHSKQQMLHPGSRHLTVLRSGEKKVVSFAPAEWRRISQVVAVLDDEVTAPLPPLGEGEERQAFRDFLYRVQRIPDWSGVSRGFLFEREAGKALLAHIERELAAPRSVHASDSAKEGDVKRRSSRLPILIQGPPASGKSRLLHWLAYQLRLRGHVVVVALPTRGRPSFEQLERACRLIEEKTEATCAVLSDGLEEGDYELLAELLASSGRRAVVVGAVNWLREKPSSGLNAAESSADFEPRASYVAFPLSSHLSSEEADRFVEFLTARRFPDVHLAQDVVQKRLFLLLLYRLLPDSRGNIHQAVAEEYERLATVLERQLEARSDTEQRNLSTWQEQLLEARNALFPEVAKLESADGASPFRHDSDVIAAIHLALMCSQVERPLSLDLLLRSQGAAFLRNYGAFSRAIEETALLQETLLDAEGTVGVEAEHPFVAEVTLRTLLPDRATQLGLIFHLIRAVRWDETSFPGENPDQDYVVGLLQAVGPRGSSEEKFHSREALEQLVVLLAEIRQSHGARLPQLLLLEANILRLLANWESASFEDSMARCRDAAALLTDAEQILFGRRPSAARSAQLQSVLTTRAVVNGFMSGACLREYTSADRERRQLLREMLSEHLSEVTRDTIRARSLGRASFFPLDVSFWAHRDQLERIPDLSDEERISLLAELESVLEVAAEEPIEKAQYERYQGRAAELALLQAKTDVAEEIAADLRAKGNFAGDCIIARRMAFDPSSRTVRSKEVGREALDYLLAFSPGILNSEPALILMHHLWIASNLDGQVIGGEDPVLARATRRDWIVWRSIIESRLKLPSNDANPYLNFCLAWALLQIDETRSAMLTLRSNESLAIGNRRRIGTLAVVTDDQGVPMEYRGTVRRFDNQQVVLYVPRLMNEVRVPARAQADLGVVSVHVGDEWAFALGLNYQGVLPRSLNT